MGDAHLTRDLPIIAITAFLQISAIFHGGKNAIVSFKEYIKDPERYIAAAKEAFGDYFFD